MNKVILMGRLTRDPEVRYSQGAEPLAIARYSLVSTNALSVRVNRTQTLFLALPLANRVSLRKSISEKVRW